MQTRKVFNFLAFSLLFVVFASKAIGQQPAQVLTIEEENGKLKKLQNQILQPVKASDTVRVEVIGLSDQDNLYIFKDYEHPENEEEYTKEKLFKNSSENPGRLYFDISVKEFQKSDSEKDILKITLVREIDRNPESREPYEFEYVFGKEKSADGTVNGFPLEDAISLSEYIQKEDYEAILTILLHYYSSEIIAQDSDWDNDNPWVWIKERVEKNPFLYNILDLTRLEKVVKEFRKIEAKEGELSIVSNSGDEISTQASSSTESATQSTSTGISFPTTLIDATGTFLADRFKKEVNIAFLDQFREQLEKQKDLQLLFPMTHTFLRETEPYNYASFLVTLRENFDSDLQQSFGNVADFLRAKDENDDLNWAILSLDLVQDLISEVHPGDIIEGLAQNTFLLEENDSLSNMLKVTSLFTQNLREPTSGAWYDDAKLTQLKTSPVAIQAFIGLILIKQKKELEAISVDNSDLYKKLTNLEVSKIYLSVSDLVSKIRVLGKYLGEIKEDSLDKEEKAALKILFLRESVELIKSGMGLYKKIINDTTNTFDPYIVVIRSALNLETSIRNQKYGQALTDVIGIISQALPKNSTNVLVHSLHKYGTFAVNLVNAKTTEEMVNALESAALPVGSYRIKRNSYFDISLNAYPGVFGGVEVVTNNAGLKGSPKFGFTWGATAPIGINLAWGHRNKWSKDSFISSATDTANVLRYLEENLKGSSSSIFFSLFDVGSVFAIRIQDGVSDLPELKFQNVFAPGVYYIYGFKDLPLSWMFGGQYGPQLRGFETTNSTDLNPIIIDRSNFRIGTGLTVDIPVFNFYTKTPDRKFLDVFSN